MARVGILYRVARVGMLYRVKLSFLIGGPSPMARPDNRQTDLTHREGGVFLREESP